MRFSFTCKLLTNGKGGYKQCYRSNKQIWLKCETHKIKETKKGGQWDTYSCFYSTPSNRGGMNINSLEKNNGDHHWDTKSVTQSQHDSEVRKQTLTTCQCLCKTTRAKHNETRLEKALHNFLALYSNGMFIIQSLASDTWKSHHTIKKFWQDPFSLQKSLLFSNDFGSQIPYLIICHI